MTIRERLQRCRVYFDGGMGSLLQKEGLQSGELPETWNLTHPDVLQNIHLAYMNAGSNVITSNTFGANCLKFDNLDAIIRAAYANLAAAKAQFAGDRDSVYFAFDVGPLGKMLEPLGDFPFERAVETFAESIRIADGCGFDLILIETMSDLYETKAAVLAAKENSRLPIIVTNAYDETAHLLTGADVPAVVATLEGLGVDALGVNCSLGPHQMLPIAKQYLTWASKPVVINPNAGIPHVADGKTLYDVDAAEFSDVMQEIAALGVHGLGGCCGTTPAYIAALVKKTASLPFVPPEEKHRTLVTSYTHAVEIGKEKIVIGERINPTGKPRLKAALRENDLGYLIREGLSQQEHGAHILDVNVGLGEIDETAMLTAAVKELQSVLDLPLQIDTVRPAALERAMRIYNGKPLINSVNAKRESMDAVFPLVKKYGGAVIALTIGDDGIPPTAAGRVALAKKIIDEAARCGIDKKDIVVDALCMTVSADDCSARITLDAVRQIKALGVNTCLGVSNVSFALPERPQINAAFLAMALEAGLDCAILNPNSDVMMGAFYSFAMLNGDDPRCQQYIDFATAHRPQPQEAAVQHTLPALSYAILKGLEADAEKAAKTLLQTTPPLTIINEQIIPALNRVGEQFENKELFLPQLLMSAEAANAAFSVVSTQIDVSGEKKDKILLATVQGDIHDIGKNIVKVLLQSYGFDVIDLGKDVPPQAVLAAAKEHGVRLVGLSALMTTTLDAMQETADLLHREYPAATVIVGGAVLTKRYADAIGAAYAKDAMETVQFAKRFFEKD